MLLAVGVLSPQGKMPRRGAEPEVTNRYALGTQTVDLQPSKLQSQPGVSNAGSVTSIRLWGLWENKAERVSWKILGLADQSWTTQDSGTKRRTGYDLLRLLWKGLRR